MALDGILLHKLIPGIQAKFPARIQKIYQISNNEILFQLHSHEGKSQLLVSCHSLYNRILITKKSYPTPNEPSNFVMVLRKYLEGATMLTITQADLDRWCTIEVRRRNDLGDVETIHLYIELMGKYANIILVNHNNIVIDALKRIPPFENARRVIHPGAQFKPTPPQDKKNPFEIPLIEEGKTLTQQFSGFSPSLAKEVEERMNHGQSFSSVMDEIQSSQSIFIADSNDNTSFHCINLTSIGPCKQYGLFEGFDILYFHKEEKDRIKEISGDVYHVVKRELKHQKQKLPRLLKEYDEAKDCAKWNKYGELLYVHSVKDTKGLKQISLLDYETDTEIIIPLDPKLDGIKNAQKCYQKYNKLKKGQIYLQEQITICEREIRYFEGLLEQLEQADFETALEIKQELVKGKYLEDKKKSNKKKNKVQAPKVTTIQMEDGTSISFGKNNLQNDALTWHIAKKNEIWLHTKDYHGAHVVIHDNNPSEETLRLAANIAAYYSKGRNSSSVPVNYCPVSSLKKIPGAKPGMVQLGNYKTIYIDPDRDEMEKYHIAVD